MNKIINFILWPAIAGLVFALILLTAPRIASFFPGLATYAPSINTLPTQTTQTLVTSYSYAIKAAAPAVVSINSQQDILIPTGNIPNESQNGNNTSRGSGVIITSDGFIITSYHIFYTAGARRLSQISTVTLSDGRIMEARPVIMDQANDLALLKIDALNLPFIGPAPQNNLEVGDIALAIGNPRNIGQSASMGIISALLRKNDSYLIQTDAAINPGNSGGALINIDGDLIGINSTIVSESGGSEGIGLAVPAYKAIELLEEYINSGPSGYLGVDAEAITVIDGLQIFDQVIQGLLVYSTTESSPAALAGIRSGDLIVAINDQKLIITSADDIGAAGAFISSHGPGAEIIFEVYRDGETLKILVTLGIGEQDTYYFVIEDEELEAETSSLSN